MPKKNNRPKQEIENIFHIYCEGEKTEPNYLNGYLNRFFPTNRLLKLIKIEPTKKNTPVQLIDEAIKKQKSCIPGDIFWVVYDRESGHKYPDPLHYSARQKANKHGISIAISNVCFEAWLILHFQDTTAAYSCYDNLRKNSVLRNECKKRGMTDYDKGDKELFPLLTNQEINLARARAKRINKLMEDCSIPPKPPHQLNPYTDVYLLLDAIDMAAKHKKVRS